MLWKSESNKYKTMEWNKIINPKNALMELPQDVPFLAIWKDYLCFAEFDENEMGMFIIIHTVKFSPRMKISEYSEKYFTHWMILPDKPKI